MVAGVLERASLPQDFRPAHPVLKEGVVAFFYPWMGGDGRKGSDRCIEGVLHPQYGFVAVAKDLWTEYEALRTPGVSGVVRIYPPAVESPFKMPAYELTDLAKAA